MLAFAVSHAGTRRDGSTSAIAQVGIFRGLGGQSSIVFDLSPVDSHSRPSSHREPHPDPSPRMVSPLWRPYQLRRSRRDPRSRAGELSSDGAKDHSGTVALREPGGEAGDRGRGVECGCLFVESCCELYQRRCVEGGRRPILPPRRHLPKRSLRKGIGIADLYGIRAERGSDQGDGDDARVRGDVPEVCCDQEERREVVDCEFYFDD